MNPTKLPPHMVRLIRQSGVHADCVVASLATLFGVTYDESLVVCSSVAPKVLDEGMNWPETRKAAKLMGPPVKALRPAEFDLHEATGVLITDDLRPPRRDHAVFLWAGRVLDGGGDLWLDADDYLAHRPAKVKALIVRTDMEAA